MKKILILFLLPLVIAGILPISVFAATPTVLDTVPSASLIHTTALGTSNNFSYTMPSGGTNTIIFFQWDEDSGVVPSAATYNGVSFTSNIKCTLSINAQLVYGCFGYIATSTPSVAGSVAFSWAGNTNSSIVAVTLKDAAQSNAVDVFNGLGDAATTTISTTATSTVGNDALMSLTARGGAVTVSSLGAGQSETAHADNLLGGDDFYWDFKAAGSTAATEVTTSNFSGSAAADHYIVAVKYQAPTVAATQVKVPDIITLE